jgi:hypothetical protein
MCTEDYTTGITLLGLLTLELDNDPLRSLSPGTFRQTLKTLSRSRNCVELLHWRFPFSPGHTFEREKALVPDGDSISNSLYNRRSLTSSFATHYVQPPRAPIRPQNRFLLTQSPRQTLARRMS